MYRSKVKARADVLLRDLSLNTSLVCMKVISNRKTLTNLDENFVELNW